MFRIFCCRNKNTTRAEIDEVTDSLEKCLSVERGLRDFKLFLERNNFVEESAALAFAMKCQSLLTDISRLSPTTRATCLPAGVQNEFSKLYEMAEDINFDLDQMNSLKDLFSPDIDYKMYTLKLAQRWAVDLLQDIYKTFRRQTLQSV